nr:hypothetical protein [Candidatus Neomarinimicrobiota bacterium]
KNFYKNFEVSNKDFEAFKKMAVEKIGDLNIKQIEKDAEYLKILIKAEIAHGYWGYDEYYKIVRLSDNQVTSAVDFLNEARKMLQIQ